jgi:hypothetical protein
MNNVKYWQPVEGPELENLYIKSAALRNEDKELFNKASARAGKILRMINNRISKISALNVWYACSRCRRRN